MNLLSFGLYRNYSYPITLSKSGKEMYKRAWCTCKVVVLVIKLLFLWSFRRRPRRWILKSLTSRFMEDVNTRQRRSFSFPELRCSLLEFKSRENCQHLKNWTRWNKRDKVRSSANSLFKWRFRSRHGRCCLSSVTMPRGDSEENIKIAIRWVSKTTANLNLDLMLRIQLQKISLAFDKVSELE